MSKSTNHFNQKENFPSLGGHKRPRTESISPIPMFKSFDRFFNIKPVSGTFKNVSPFLIHKSLSAQFGSLSDTKKLADGSLLIEVRNEDQSFIAQNLKKIHTFEVTCIPHKSLNTVKGVVTCSDLSNCSDEEILENLQSQGVISIYRLPQKKESSNPSSTFILTFKLHQLPNKIYAGWYSLRVRPYFPNPMRCFNCQKFGHTASKCSHESTCPSCGHSSHPDSPCSKSPICSNCSREHSPRYRGCPEFKQEFEIQKIRTLEKLSYFEAKRKYLSTNPSFYNLYSTVAKGPKPTMVSESTQCDLSITLPQSSDPPPTNSFKPILLPPPISPSPIIPIPTPSPIPPPPIIPPKKPSNESSSKNQTKTDTSTKPSQSTKQSTSKTLQNRFGSISNSSSQKDSKKKNNRSAKSTPNSSNESILELSSSDTFMELDPIAPQGKLSKRK